jgi:hypothetical protein
MPRSSFLLLGQPTRPACLLTNMQTSLHARGLVCLQASFRVSRKTSLLACFLAAPRQFRTEPSLGKAIWLSFTAIRPESLWEHQSHSPENGQGGLWEPRNEGRPALKPIPRPSRVPGPYTASKSGLASLNPPAFPPHRKCLRDGFPGTGCRATPDPTGIGDREYREMRQPRTGI